MSLIPATQDVAVADLRPHPRNYRTHPDDQLAQLAHSIEQLGFFRPVVLAQDGTILAGHGIVLAAQRLGRTHVPAIRLPLHPLDKRALKVLVSDNESRNLAMPDDRALTELLKELQTADSLMGTGFSEASLAALLFATRPATEVPDLDRAAEWAGTGHPHDPGSRPAVRVIFTVATADALPSLLAVVGASPENVMKYSGGGKLLTLRWPLQERLAPGALTGAAPEGATVKKRGKTPQ